jgi:hypothetical protein
MESLPKEPYFQKKKFNKNANPFSAKKNELKEGSDKKEPLNEPLMELDS